MLYGNLCFDRVDGSRAEIIYDPKFVDKRVAALRKLIEKYPNCRLEGWSRNYMLFQMIGPAIRKMTEGVRGNKLVAWSQYEIAQQYQQTGDHVSAIREYRKVIESHPGTRLGSIAQTMMWSCYKCFGDPDKMLQEYNGYIRQHPKGKHVATAKYWIKFIEDNSDFGRRPLSHYLRGSGYQMTGRYEKAHKEFKTIFEKYPSSTLADDAKTDADMIEAHRTRLQEL